jgi:hypothetical protein
VLLSLSERTGNCIPCQEWRAPVKGDSKTHSELVVSDELLLLLDGVGADADDVDLARGEGVLLCGTDQNQTCGMMQCQDRRVPTTAWRNWHACLVQSLEPVTKDLLSEGSGRQN